MRASDELLGAVFNEDHRYVIPTFRRTYVWDEQENWMPPDTMHPMNNRDRREAETRMAALGWATKDAGRSARYELHREL
jgi:hypothetical protein